MKLDKAIELNKDSAKSLRSHKFIDHADAIQLGVEALIRLKELRVEDPLGRYYYLPGEDSEATPKRSLHHIKAVLESPLGKEPRKP